jgi:predicted metal-dependent peptidase
MRYLTEDQKIFNAYLNGLNKKGLRILSEQDYSISKEAKEMDPELFKEFDLRLARARFFLQKDHSFYWRILNICKTVPTFSVPTMAVDALRNIYINPKFTVNTLDQDGVTAVLVHECGHILGESFFRKGSRDHELWNVATDYIINRDLLEDGFKLPDYENFKALLPKRVNDRWVIEKYDNVDITTFTAERMYEFIKKQQKNKPNTVEEDVQKTQKFDHPPEDDGQEGGGQEPQDDGQEGGGQEPQEGDQKGGSGGEGQEPQEGDQKGGSGGEGQEPQEGDQKGGSGKGGKSGKKIVPLKAPNGDDRYEPNRNDDGKTIEEQDQENKDVIRRAYDQEMRDNPGSFERGTGSGSGRGSLFKKDILKTKTDWKAITRKFVGGIPRIEKTWDRPSRRYWTSTGLYMPSEKSIKDSLDLVVAVDTSGSISTTQIHTFLNEIVTLAASRKNIKLKVLFWMDSVYASLDLDSKLMSLSQMQTKFREMGIRNDGGTTISSVKSYLEKEGIKKIEGMIYFTDGYVESNPQIPNVKNKRILFMITPGGITRILEKYGQTVEVDVK